MRILLLTIVAGCAPTSGPRAIEAGDYQFYTLSVGDACLDGALEALFMPGGRDQRHPFEFPIYIPSASQTPLSYDVDFRVPFVGMPVTVETSEEGMSVRGSVMDAVQLDAGQYGDCVTTMVVDADLWPDGRRELAGEARIAVSDPRGTEGRCPVFDEVPCQVTLTLQAEYLGDASP